MGGEAELFLLSAVKNVDEANVHGEIVNCDSSLSALLWKFCSIFGHTITLRIHKPIPGMDCIIKKRPYIPYLINLKISELRKDLG